MENGMTPEEFKLIRIRNGMTQVDVAKFLDRSERSVIRWEAGHNTIPWIVQMLMIKLDEGVIDLRDDQILNLWRRRQSNED